MLKGWNRKVRMTSAMISACAITRMVSAKAPSWRFSVDTLIGLSPEGSGDLCFVDEPDRWIAIGTRCIRHLPRIVDEIRCDLGCARAEMPDVVTDQRKFDRVRAVADQLRKMAAQGRPRHRVELAGQQQGRHAGADR